MAITLSNKANNVSTSNPTVTGSLTWAAGSRGIVAVASASNIQISAHSATGGSVTWNVLGTVAYGSRRRITILLSDDTPADGTVSITATVGGGGSFQETQYSVDQIEGFDDADPDDAAVTAAGASGTSLNIGDVGTIDTGDLVYAAFGMENASNGLVPATGSTAHVTREGGGNVRSFMVAFSTTDDTPGATWNSSGSSGGVAFIINVGASSSHFDESAAFALEAGQGHSPAAAFTPSATFANQLNVSPNAQAALSTAIALALSQDAATSPAVSFSPSIVLATGLTASDSGAANFQPSIAIPLAIGLTAEAQASLSAALTLAVAVSHSATSANFFQEAAAFGLTLDKSAQAGVVFRAATALALGAGLTIEGAVAFGASVAFAADLEFGAAQGQQNFPESIALAIAAGVATEAAVNYSAAVSLAAALDIQPAVQGAFGASVSLGVGLGKTMSAQAAFDAAVALAASLDVVAAHTYQANPTAAFTIAQALASTSSLDAHAAAVLGFALGMASSAGIPEIIARLLTAEARELLATATARDLRLTGNQN